MSLSNKEIMDDIYGKLPDVSQLSKAMKDDKLWMDGQISVVKFNKWIAKFEAMLVRYNLLKDMVTDFPAYVGSTCGFAYENAQTPFNLPGGASGIEVIGMYTDMARINNEPDTCRMGLGSAPLPFPLPVYPRDDATWLAESRYHEAYAVCCLSYKLVDECLFSLIYCSISDKFHGPLRSCTSGIEALMYLRSLLPVQSYDYLLAIQAKFDLLHVGPTESPRRVLDAASVLISDLCMVDVARLDEPSQILVAKMLDFKSQVTSFLRTWCPAARWKILFIGPAMMAKYVATGSWFEFGILLMKEYADWFEKDDKALHRKDSPKQQRLTLAALGNLCGTCGGKHPTSNCRMEGGAVEEFCTSCRAYGHLKERCFKTFRKGGAKGDAKGGGKGAKVKAPNSQSKGAKGSGGRPTAAGKAQQKADERKCSYCKKTGHVEKDCWQKMKEKPKLLEITDGTGSDDTSDTSKRKSAWKKNKGGDG